MPIRRLTCDDYAAYYPLIREFRETEFTEEQFWNDMRGMPWTQEIWVWEEDREMLGTITVIYEPKFIFNRCMFAHIEDVCVRESARKKGIGSQLLQHVIQEAKTKGCLKITLVCNESVAPFYFANQFEKRGIQCSRLLRSG